MTTSPYVRLLGIIDALPRDVDDTEPLRTHLPGIWPTVGDLRALLNDKRCGDCKKWLIGNLMPMGNILTGVPARCPKCSSCQLNAYYEPQRECDCLDEFEPHNEGE